jgi:PEGA domain/Domain of unknown function (DUF4410)
LTGPFYLSEQAARRSSARREKPARNLGKARWADDEQRRKAILTAQMGEIMRPSRLAMAVTLFAMPLLAKNLDRINWTDRAAWNCVKVVAIRPFPVTGEFKGEKSQDEYMKYLVARLSSEIVRPGGIERVVLVAKGDSPNADAVITGEFLELSAGSRAARFWVGFGAGTARTDVSMQAYRADERTPIFDLGHARVAPFSLSGDANIGDIEAVVSDIGEELRRRHVECNPAEVKPIAVREQAVVAAPVADAEISIESSVANAEVYVDGKFVGNAPLPKFRMTQGEHEIKVRAVGYRDWKRQVSVSANAASRVVAELEKQP